MEEVEVPILIIPVAVNNLCKLFLVPMMCRDMSDSTAFRAQRFQQVARVINRSMFDYIDRTAYRAMAFEYLDFSPVHPFIPGIRAWISLLFMEDGNEGVIDVFGIEMDFRDAANSREEVLWLLDMLDWK
ncbi:hypothetical protein GH714_012611 [Hevea brasiliensis]|uniref:Uncharacterized protein n=1 Tax=Hevea brasiliensis TaxID=3981 RepID=A0A6A6MK51_HEVBR|nr:hypothetical protein GH714_012611 [Hevea brasiliensis]